TALQTIPQAVARAVATAITGALRPVERTALASRPPRDPGAYDRFLRANYELAQRTPRAVRRAIDQYQGALRLDPGFTPALARVAVGYGLFLDWGGGHSGLYRMPWRSTRSARVFRPQANATDVAATERVVV